MNVLFRQLRDEKTVAFTLDHAATVKRALIVKGKEKKWLCPPEYRFAYHHNVEAEIRICDEKQNVFGLVIR